MLRHRFALSLIAIAAVAFASDAAAFIVYKVGGDADCPYTSIQDAVDAAAANPGTDDIWIAMNASYTGQQVHIVDQDVVIEGGFTDCDDIDIDTAETTVSGAGNAGGAVFTIRGTSNVYFSNLFITGASRDGDASGGGIDFDGAGSVELHESTIGLNSAGYGGGINMHGDGGHADLTLDNDMVILNNTAYTSGGGIRIEGDTRFYALQPNTLIDGNHAPGGYGGGLEVLGPARADIGSPGYGDLGVIFFNDAQYGGGIAALAINDGQEAIVRVFTTDPNNPVQISDNFASATGGGVYLKPKLSIDSATDAGLCAYDFRIHDNVAQEGTAIYADEDFDGIADYHGGDVALNTLGSFASNSCVTPEAPPALGAVACAAGTPCNEINDNVAEDANAVPTAGSTILMQEEGDLYADRFSMRGNQGGHLVREITSSSFKSLYAFVFLSDCLLADNALTQELAVADGGSEGSFSFENCTLANNQIGAPYVMLMSGNFQLHSSIVDQPGRATLDYTGGNGGANASYVLSNDISTLGAGDGIIEGEPTFVDAANGDYHLQTTSLGVDFAPTGTTRLDLDRNTRVVDLPDVTDTSGPLDLGAYEIQVDTVLGCANADTVFCDGFDG